MIDSEFILQEKNISRLDLLETATLAGNFSMVAGLIEDYQPELNREVNGVEFPEISLLGLAILGRNPEIVSLLFEKGLEINSELDTEDILLDYAIRSGSAEMIAIVNSLKSNDF
jgi:ankyrin repeat protein